MSPVPRIDRYAFGKITIDGESYTGDVIIFPDHVRKDWWRSAGHSLLVGDMGEILLDPPELLVIGMGALGRMKIPADTRDMMEELGIKWISASTAEACDIYNAERELRRTIAALHLTC
jgi:hypothetical protein